MSQATKTTTLELTRSICGPVSIPSAIPHRRWTHSDPPALMERRHPMLCRLRRRTYSNSSPLEARQNRRLRLGKIHVQRRRHLRLGRRHQRFLQEVDRLKKAGIAVYSSGAAAASARRHVHRVDDRRRRNGTPGSTLPFAIEDQTPRALARATLRCVKERPSAGVENVVLGVNNLDAAIALFRRAYDGPKPLVENRETSANSPTFPASLVILAAPSSGGWLSEHLAKFGETPLPTCSTRATSPPPPKSTNSAALRPGSVKE